MRGGLDDPEMRDRAFRQLDGAAAQLLRIAPARHPDRSGWRSAPGTAYLAFLAAIPLAGPGRPDSGRRQ